MYSYLAPQRADESSTMDIAFSLAIVLHVLPAVFWAGSTFVLARNGGLGAEGLIVPQLGAGAVTIVVGLYVWVTSLGMGPGPVALSLGAAFAVLAFIVQAAMVAPVRRRIASEPAARGRAAIGERVSALLLAMALIGMVVR